MLVFLLARPRSLSKQHFGNTWYTHRARIDNAEKPLSYKCAEITLAKVRSRTPDCVVITTLCHTVGAALGVVKLNAPINTRRNSLRRASCPRYYTCAGRISLLTPPVLRSDNFLLTIIPVRGKRTEADGFFASAGQFADDERRARSAGISYAAR